MAAHRQHGHGKRPPRDPRPAERGKRASSGAPTGAIVRPARPPSAKAQRASDRRRSRYGDNGVASLGEARAHQRLRRHTPEQPSSESKRAPARRSRLAGSLRRDRRIKRPSTPRHALRAGRHASGWSDARVAVLVIVPSREGRLMQGVGPCAPGVATTCGPANGVRPRAGLSSTQRRRARTSVHRQPSPWTAQSRTFRDMQISAAHRWTPERIAEFQTASSRATGCHVHESQIDPRSPTYR